MIGEYQQGQMILPIGPPDNMLGNIDPRRWGRIRRIYSTVGRRVRVEIIGRRTLDLVTIENTWWDFIEPMRCLLERAHEMADPDHPDHHNSENFKPFRLLPLARPGQHSIQINTTTLHYLYRDAGIDGVPVSVANFNQEFPTADAQWAVGFDLDPATSAGRVFSSSLTTNGLYCSVSIRVPAPAEDQQRLRERREANQQQHDPAAACQERRLGQRQQRQQQQVERQQQIEDGREAQG